MLKRIILLLLSLLFICSVGFIIVSAEDEVTTEIVTEQVTEAETTSFTTSEPETVSQYTIDDIHYVLLFILFGLFCIVGCLIAQGFSFWKW